MSTAVATFVTVVYIDATRLVPVTLTFQIKEIVFVVHCKRYELRCTWMRSVRCSTMEYARCTLCTATTRKERRGTCIGSPSWASVTLRQLIDIAAAYPKHRRPLPNMFWLKSV